MFFSLLLLPLTVALCPYGSTYYAASNTCYLTSELHVHWTAAESICQNLGGHLASIKDQQQNNFVYVGIETMDSPVWIGATHATGQWGFSDGTPLVFDNFLQKSKNSGKHSRAVMLKGQFNQKANGKWEIVQDDKNILRPFVCELPVCRNGTVPRSLLNPQNNATGLIYGTVSNTWLYGNTREMKPFNEALKLCKTAVGNLPSIRNSFENTQLKEAATTLFGPLFWPELILGYQSDISGHWSWTDGNNATYTNWAKLEPTTSIGAHSILNLDNGDWYARIDTLNRYFICEFSIPSGQTCSA